MTVIMATAVLKERVILYKNKKTNYVNPNLDQSF